MAYDSLKGGDSIWSQVVRCGEATEVTMEIYQKIGDRELDSRVVAVALQSKFLLDALRGVLRFVNLPEDATILRRFRDDWANEEVMVLHSAAFDVVPEGEIVPRVGLIFTRMAEDGVIHVKLESLPVTRSGKMDTYTR